jgi:hypothetical protein
MRYRAKIFLQHILICIESDYSCIRIVFSKIFNQCEVDVSYLYSTFYKFQFSIFNTGFRKNNDLD